MNLQQYHELEIKNLKNQLQQQNEIELEQIKTQRDEIETQKDEIELENFAIKLKHETEIKKMQEKLEQAKKETEPDETEEEEPDEPQVDDIVYWKDENIEGAIEEIEEDIAYVDFEGYDDLVEIKLEYLKDGDDVWVYEKNKF